MLFLKPEAVKIIKYFWPLPCPACQCQPWVRRSSVPSALPQQYYDLFFFTHSSKRFGSVIGQQKLKNDKEPIGFIVHISKLNFTQHFSMIYLSLLNDTWNFTSYSSLARLRSPYTAICTPCSTAWIQTARLIKKSIKAILFTRIPCLYHMDQWCNVYTISKFLPKQALDTHITSLYCVTYPILNC